MKDIHIKYVDVCGAVQNSVKLPTKSRTRQKRGRLEIANGR